MISIRSKYFICELFGIPITADVTSLGLLLLLVFDLGLPLGLPCAILLAVSIVLHELAHSLTSRAFGCSISEIRLSILGGCASGEIPRAAWKELLMAAAGPAMSFLIGFGLLFGLSGVVVESDWLCAVLGYAMVMNLMLGAFNLLPGFPMDGGRIFRCVMRVFVSRASSSLSAPSRPPITMPTALPRAIKAMKNRLLTVLEIFSAATTANPRREYNWVMTV